MRPNQLPPEIMRHLPPPEVLDCLSLAPREKPEVMIEIVAGWVDRVADLMTTEAWQGRLRESIRGAVAAGTLPTLQVIAAAERSRVVDEALRDMLAERLDLPGDVAATTALRGYMQKAIRRDITVDSQGRPEDNFGRDIGITVLMTLTMVRWPYLRKRPSRVSKRPSASMIVAEALNRRHITGFKPGRVVEIFDSHDLLAGRLVGLIAA